MQEKLYQKLFAEYKEFIADLKKKPPDEIIFNSAKVACMQNILYALHEFDFLNEDDVAKILESDSASITLNDLYDDYANPFEASIRSSIREHIALAIKDRIAYGF